MLQLPYKLILASKSPRRKDLLQTICTDFTIKTKNVEEVYPSILPTNDVPEYLALLKAKALLPFIDGNEVLLSADTIVCLGDKIYGKPKDAKDAKYILQELSGKAHKVITGVALVSKYNNTTFKSTTQVYFKDLSKGEINYYIKNYKPYDKAGAYAIQEWIGMIGIEKIEGDYFNVVGLPMQKTYQALKEFKLS